MQQSPALGVQRDAKGRTPLELASQNNDSSAAIMKHLLQAAPKPVQGTRAESVCSNSKFSLLDADGVDQLLASEADRAGCLCKGCGW